MLRDSWIIRLWNGADTTIDSLLFKLSVYGVPVAIALASLIALTTWESQYNVSGAKPLDFRVFEQASEMLEPIQALARLDESPTVQHYDTRLSESSFWFRFSVLATDEDTDVEFPSRHALATTCWDIANMHTLGGASRTGASGQMDLEKAGFSLALGSVATEVTILCKATFSGPARISVVQWPAAQLDTSSEKFHRNAGLLEGGLIVLSLFVLTTAIINREWLYVLFAAWLVANLRLAAISSGWDTQWLERVVPPEWMLLTRKLTIAAYYTLTYTLFTRLFREDLKQVGYSYLLKLAQWSCILLLIMAVALPFSKYLPYLWITTIFGIFVLVFHLARILIVTRSTVAIWYSASMGIILFASLYEVFAAALGIRELIGSVNSVTAALSSSLMAALAIAEQMKQEHVAKVEAQTELRNTYEAIPIGLFTLDEEGFFVRSNPSLNDKLGVSLSGSNRSHWNDFFEAGSWSALQDTVKRDTSLEMEIHSRSSGDEDLKWFLVKATLSKGRIEGSLQDITERNRATEKLRFLAENDPLTGVLNRRGIEKVFALSMTSLVKERTLALAYLDLDRFKLINDLFGHAAGDEVLKQLCHRIQELLTANHNIGRVGGDEFIILFWDTPIRSAKEICRGIVEKIGTQPYQIDDKAFQVKGSIGLIDVATGTEVKDAISAADRACRAAKAGHHGGLVVYEKNASEFGERDDELRMIKRFGRGVVPEGLFLLMQPVMSLNEPYQSLNFEILLRMRDADESIIQAGKIISVAENNGHSAVIDRWVLSNTLSWLDTHHNALNKTHFVCMNLGGASLNDERFVEDAFAMLGQYDRRTVELLCLEVTESVALHDLKNTRRFIDKVRSFGAMVALDDFGAGYTSFSYLKELPADIVKIDGAIILDVNKHPADLTIVESIAALVNNLGMKTIAEWAEDRATVETLAAVGIDYVQGYAIARPQFPDKILLADSSASFIQDETVAEFVRSLAEGHSAQLWDQFADLPPRGIH